MTPPNFCNHIIVDKNPDDYTEIVTSPAAIFDTWRLSFFAHELLRQDGSVKNESELDGNTLQKFIAASEALKRGEAIEKPVLGIGLNDGIEIGIGREIVAAAYHAGEQEITASVRKAQIKDISKLLGTGKK